MTRVKGTRSRRLPPPPPSRTSSRRPTSHRFGGASRWTPHPSATCVPCGQRNRSRTVMRHSNFIQHRDDVAMAQNFARGCGSWVLPAGHATKCTRPGIASPRFHWHGEFSQLRAAHSQLCVRWGSSHGALSQTRLATMRVHTVVWCRRLCARLHSLPGAPLPARRDNRSGCIRR